MGGGGNDAGRRRKGESERRGMGSPEDGDDGSREVATHRPQDVAARSVGRTTTVLPADGVERCPAFPDLAAVPGYALDAATGASRDGCIALYRISSSGSIEGPLGAPLRSSGVFDVRWRPFDEAASAQCLAQAAADGSVAVYSLEGAATPSPSSSDVGEAMDVRLTERARVSTTGGGDSTGAMCTSVAWVAGADGSCDTLAATRSDGRAALLRVREGGDLEVDRVWFAHALHGAPVEVWWAESDTRGGKGTAPLLYTGADDALLKAWDLREDLARPAISVRHHDKGVCHVALSPHDAHELTTGSYDDHVRWWDARALARGPVHEIDLGGGGWRIRFHPLRPDLALAACMYNGCALVARNAQSGKWEVRDRYLGHNSITYGCEWFHPRDCTGDGAHGTPSSPGLAASVSFYDCQLHVWAPACAEVRADVA